jgi:hypothetical protein
MIIIRCIIFVLLALVLLPAKNASAQSADTPYQVGVVTEDLTRIDTTVAMTNSGASSTVASPQNGALCFNAYAMPGPGNAVTACCTCRVQPNGLRLLSVGKDLLGSLLSKPHTTVVKLMASTGTAGTCNAGTVGTGANVLATGMLAWLVVPTSPDTALTFKKTPFVPSTLSAAELTALISQCSSIGTRACNSTCL